MAANLNQINGRVSMAAMARIPVWHGTGQRTDHLMGFEESAGLGQWDYPVETMPAGFQDPDGIWRAGDGVQIVRTDTMQALGKASNGYAVCRNRRAFEPIRYLISRGELAGILTCGVIGDGQKAWMQAAVDEFEIGDGDRGVVSLLCANSHNTSEAITYGWTAWYVVCGNTYTAALQSMERDGAADAGTMFRITHTGDMEQKIRTVSGLIDCTRRTIAEHVTVGRELAGVPIEPADVWHLALAAMPPSDVTLQAWKEGKASTGYWRNQYEAIMREYFDGTGSDVSTRRGTAFGAWNAITGYVDYGRRPTATPSERARMVQFGSGAEIKRNALQAACDRWIEGKPWSEQTQEAAELCPLG